MREAWVLLSRGVGDVICSKARVESVETVLSFGAGGEQNWGVGAVLARAAGDRLKWEAWMLFRWVTGATLRGGAVFSCGAGGGDIIIDEVFSWGREGGELKGGEVVRGAKKVGLSVGAELRDGAEGVVVSRGAEWVVCCRGVVLRQGWKGGGCGSRWILGDHSGPSCEPWTPGWIWNGGWDWGWMWVGVWGSVSCCCSMRTWLCRSWSWAGSLLIKQNQKNHHLHHLHNTIHGEDESSSVCWSHKLSLCSKPLQKWAKVNTKNALPFYGLPTSSLQNTVQP